MIAVQEQHKNNSTYISVFRYFSLHKAPLKCPLTSSIAYKNRSRLPAGKRRGIRWNFTTVLEDLDFTDDISLLSSKFNDLHKKTGRLAEEAVRVGTKTLMRESVRH